VSEVANMTELPYLEESYLNWKVHNMIEECKRLKGEYNHQIKIWCVE
jgi:hypothetical protein